MVNLRAKSYKNRFRFRDQREKPPTLGGSGHRGRTGRPIDPLGAVTRADSPLARDAFGAGRNVRRHRGDRRQHEKVPPLAQAKRYAIPQHKHGSKWVHADAFAYAPTDEEHQTVETPNLMLLCSTPKSSCLSSEEPVTSPRLTRHNTKYLNENGRPPYVVPGGLFVQHAHCLRGTAHRYVSPPISSEGVTSRRATGLNAACNTRSQRRGAIEVLQAALSPGRRPG